MWLSTWNLACVTETTPIFTVYPFYCMAWCRTHDGAREMKRFMRMKWEISSHVTYNFRQYNIMKRLIPGICFLLLVSLSHSNASIWIKNVKSYGPSASAFGVKCLTTMTKLYLKEPSLSRSRNLVVSYIQNLTIPADNVQRLFLKWIHEAIVQGDVDE